MSTSLDVLSMIGDDVSDEPVTGAAKNEANTTLTRTIANDSAEPR